MIAKPKTGNGGNAEGKHAETPWETVENPSTVSPPTPPHPPISAGSGQPSFPNFENGGSEKNECLGSLNESLPQMFTWTSLLCFLSINTL